MKCYHLSKDIFKSITEFVPKVPKYLLSGEDNTIERICVGLTIEDCLNGLCYLPNMSNRLFYESVDCSEIVGDLYRSMKVYEFEINESDLISSDDLRDYVPDAYKTNECWLLKSIKPIKEYIIDIKDFDLNEEYLIEKVIYTNGTLSNFYTMALIQPHETDDIDIIVNGLNTDMMISSKGSNNNIIILNLDEFPLIKQDIKNVLNLYFTGLKCDITYK